MVGMQLRQPDTVYGRRLTRSIRNSSAASVLRQPRQDSKLAVSLVKPMKFAIPSIAI